MSEKTASQQIRAALVERGYRLQARRYIEANGSDHRVLYYYYHRDKDQEAVLEIISDESVREEVACELRIPVSNTSDIAATIAAIP